MEDEQQSSRIKDWISSCHTDTVELTDVLSNFPDISVVSISTVQLSARRTTVPKMIVGTIGKTAEVLLSHALYPLSIIVSI